MSFTRSAPSFASVMASTSSWRSAGWAALLLELLLDEAEVAEDVGEGVVDFVAHSRREPAHGGEPVREEQLILGCLEAAWQVSALQLAGALGTVSSSMAL